MLPRLRTVLAAALATFVATMALTGWVSSRFAAAGRIPQIAGERLLPPDLSADIESRIAARRDEELRRLMTQRIGPMRAEAGTPPPQAEPVHVVAVATITSSAPEAAVLGSVPPPQLRLEAPEIPEPVVIAIAALSVPPPGTDANAALSAEIPVAAASVPEPPPPAVESPAIAQESANSVPPPVIEPQAATEAFASLPTTEIPWPRKVRRLIGPRLVDAKPAKPLARATRSPAKQARKPANPRPPTRRQTPEEQFWSSQQWSADPFAPQPQARGRSQPQ